MMSSGPHQITMANDEPRQVLTAERRLRGHWRGGPSGVEAQSKARISAPSSPPPDRKRSDDADESGTGAEGLESCSVMTGGMISLAPWNQQARRFRRPYPAGRTSARGALSTRTD